MKMYLEGEKVGRRDTTALGESEAQGPPRGSFRAWGEEPAQPKGMCPTPRLSFSRFRGGGAGEDQDRLRGPVGLLGPGPLPLAARPLLLPHFSLPA